MGWLKVKKRIIIIVFLFMLILLTVGCSKLEFFNDNQNEIPNKTDENEWSKPEDNSPSYDFASLYNLRDVPKLEKLFINSTFIKHISINHFSYLHGFSSDGRYVSLINYIETNEQGYLVNIFDTITGNIVYSIFVPDDENLLDSNELALAQEALEDVFKINVPPKKLIWKNGLAYQANKTSWVFEVTKNNERVNLKINNLEFKDTWTLFLVDQQDFYGYLELFSFPGKPEWLTFIYHLSYYTTGDRDFILKFVNLENLTSNNSDEGVKEGVDNWLYGSFNLIYNQWNTGSNKGFIAISGDNERVGDKGYLEQVKQWIYLDPSGKMEWYGNYQGVFNSRGASAQRQKQSLGRDFYYRINLIKDNNDSLQYFIIDQFDSETKSLYRTIEFKWDPDVLEMVPVQNFQT
ncbi:hypothetical protein BHF71_09750 [Vulcanibacillus modesticaldus]|uniref:Uncharacterized protein n=1 Tax=Vulcanibacillus modesticaldus TaxID=337097 RepID=A0A1D2YU06_9BACI|nr:hypothetical protein [Vulcanibacillus modesticaldus]OEF99188.1 hypothetical protein BHF71_09750 [Vulcanibacillus modesticaldus]